MMSDVLTRHADLWNYYSLEYACTLPCSSARRFLWWMRSPSTHKVRCMMSVPSGSAQMTAYGPLVDEAIWDEEGKGARLMVKYTLTREECYRGLDHLERKELADLCREKREGFKFDLLCTALNLRRVV